MQQNLDYQSRHGSGEQVQPRRAWIAVAVIVGVINLLLVLLASHADGRGGQFVGMLLSPAANLVIGVVALCAAPSVKRAAGRTVHEQYVLAAIGLPIIAVIGDFWLIATMGWFGC